MKKVNKTSFSGPESAKKGKVCCPKCGNEMDPVEPPHGGRQLRFSASRLLAIKRYLCYGCFWEVRRWGKSESPIRFKRQLRVV